jgi:hypothetical protein
MSGDHIKHDEVLAAKIDEEWEKQDSVANGLNEQGAEDFFTGEKNNFPDLKSAFVEKKKCVCCMDEGTAHMKMEGKLCMAGSGILYPASSYEERLQKVAKIYIKKEIRNITSHDGCGAAGIAWKALKDGERKDLNVKGINTPDEYGKKWAEDLKETINEILRKENKGSVVRHDHIAGKEMVRPEEFHNARTVWFDCTGKFDPAKLGERIPKGFVIDDSEDAKYDNTKDSQEYPFVELAVAIQIALGDHGLNDKFSKSPFTIVVVAPSAEVLEDMKKEITSRLPADKKDKIKVDGFVEPEK